MIPTAGDDGADARCELIGLAGGLGIWGLKPWRRVFERYHYNALGERVLREPREGAAVRTLYDEQGRRLGDYRADGSPVQQAIWLDDLPVALLTTTAAGLPSLAYIEPDHLGTPRVVIDSDRDVAWWRWPLEKDAFGAHAPEDDVDGDGIAFELNLRHPGQQYTAASGLYYNYYRDLDASIGRYVQSDPIGLAGGISAYGYVAGRPLLEIDPQGLRGRLTGRPLNNPGFKSAPPALTPDGYPAQMPARATIDVSPPAAYGFQPAKKVVRTAGLTGTCNRRGATKMYIQADVEGKR